MEFVLPTGRRLGWIRVRGESMWPVLRAGDLAGFVRRVEPAREGEVVVVRAATGLIVHRVRDASPRGLVLRGDACVIDDPALPPSRVLGRVESVFRGGALLSPAQWDRPMGRLGPWLARVRRWAERAA